MKYKKIITLVIILVFSSLVYAKDFIINNGTDNVFVVTSPGNATLKLWYRGMFDWRVGNTSIDYLSFNGTQLDFNETKLNATIDDRAREVDGGFANSIYLPTQLIDGGSA